jgi:hypothetical protein
MPNADPFITLAGLRQRRRIPESENMVIATFGLKSSRRHAGPGQLSASNDRYGPIGTMQKKWFA